MDNNFSNLNTNTKKKLIHQKDNVIIQNGELYTHEGENITHLYEFQLNPKIYLSEEQQERYRSKKLLGDHEIENGGFVFLFYQTLHSISEYMPNLNKSDITRLMFLSTYVSFEDNRILYDNGRSIPDKDLSDMLKIQKKRYREFIKKLVNNKILYIDEQGNKYLSYNICKYGTLDKEQLQNENIAYIRLFKATVRKVFQDTPVRELGRLSTIYMILPYLNLTTNIISHNPEEIEVEKVEPMTLMELSKVLGYTDYTKLKKALYSIKIDNCSVFGFFLHEDDKRTMKIVVNPRIVYAGNGSQLGSIKALFK